MTPEVEELLRAAVAEKKSADSVFTREDGKPIKDFRGAEESMCPCWNEPIGVREVWGAPSRGEVRMWWRPQNTLG
jgi:hypothetical protein